MAQRHNGHRHVTNDALLVVRVDVAAEAVTASPGPRPPRRSRVPRVDR
jgi:hypothetical protein